jgi:hypothetical protein
MTIFLTSFKRYFDSKCAVPGYSIAVYQPRWYPKLPKIDMFDIRDENGQWTLPRNFVIFDEFGEQKNSDMDVLRDYHDTLVAMYHTRFKILGSIPEITKDAALCCWCPYEKAAKRQLEHYGTFVCHSMAVETFLKEIGIEVVRDKDREKMVMITSP